MMILTGPSAQADADDMALGTGALTIVRSALLLALFLIAVSVVMALGNAETGPLEKAALGCGMLVVVAAAAAVHRMRRR